MVRVCQDSFACWQKYTLPRKSTIDSLLNLESHEYTEHALINTFQMDQPSLQLLIKGEKKIEDKRGEEKDVLNFYIKTTIN